MPMDENPSRDQMQEFMDQMRREHDKTYGKPTISKALKPKEKRIDYDSMSEITDLSDQGILVTSMQKLSKDEQKKLR